MNTARSARSILFVSLWIAAAWGCGGGPGGNDAETSSAERTRGFVLSSFGYDYPQFDANPCPNGFNLGPLERQMQGGAPFADDCNHPEANRDTSFKTLDAIGRVDGFDLDGRTSVKTAPRGDECPHDDFNGLNGETGFDFQMFRALGCIRGFQRGEIVDLVIDSAVKTGAMTAVVELLDVDDERNDDSVRVHVLASLDAPPVGADGSVLPYGTVSAHPDPRYHGDIVTGRLVDGIITAGPMNLRLRLNIQIVQGDLSLQHAWLRAELMPDGSVQGRLFGYEPIEEIYDIFGRQAGADGAEAISYTCSGLYAAFTSEADGDFDPVTGTCSSLSVVYRFSGIPVFVAR